MFYYMYSSCIPAFYDPSEHKCFSRIQNKKAYLPFLSPSTLHKKATLTVDLLILNTGTTESVILHSVSLCHFVSIQEPVSTVNS